jgi:ParB-like chromosome segregation protein Spo0J
VITPEGKYEIIDGNHRLQAAKNLGIKNIPYEIHTL